MPEKTPYPTPDPADGIAGGEFQLFHGRLLGRGGEIGVFVGVLLGWLLLVSIFWLLLARFDSAPLPVWLTYWALLLGGPVEVGRRLYNVFRPGLRRYVYGVNSRVLLRKRLRGETHPLWNAARAPATLDFADWDPFQGEWVCALAKFTVSAGPEAISLKEAKEMGIKMVGLDGKERTPVEQTIQKTDFDDARAFEGLKQALKGRPQPGQP